jgi:hypothetical protein
VSVNLTGIRLFFDEGRPFNLRNIKPYKRVIGLYFIYNNEIEIRYPFRESRLIYIGMSEKITNSVGNRLQNHLEGTSGNEGIVNYTSVNGVSFTILNFKMLKEIWIRRIEDLESYFISDFAQQYGVYPICNNKSGIELLDVEPTEDFNIDWNFFEK